MSLFKVAKALTPAAAKKKAGSKKEIQVQGVEQLAMIDAMEKALEAVRGTFEAEVKGYAGRYFMSEIKATGRRPESFRGIEGGASASLELRKRGTNMPLNDEQIALLRANGIEPAREVLVPALFGINPAYASDEALLERVSGALAGIVPDDFIVAQPERVKFIVDDAMLEAACASKAPAEVIQTMTVLGCKPKLVLTDMNAILAFVRSILAAPAMSEASIAAAAAVTQ